MRDAARARAVRAVEVEVVVAEEVEAEAVEEEEAAEAKAVVLVEAEAVEALAGATEATRTLPGLEGMIRRWPRWVLGYSVPACKLDSSHYLTDRIPLAHLSSGR